MAKGGPRPYPNDPNQQAPPAGTRYPGPHDPTPPGGFVQPGTHPGYPPQYPHHQFQGPTVITTQPSPVTIVTTAPSTLGYNPQRMTCPHCHADVLSKVQFETGILAHIAAGVCIVFGCWCGCCLIPYSMDTCKDAQHECSNCNRPIGTRKRL